MVTPRAAWYLAIEGSGEPWGNGFDARLDALRLADRTLRAIARRHGVLHPPARLEAQWWVDAPDGVFPDAPTDRWRWRLLLSVPDAVTAGILRDAATRLTLARGRHPLVADVELVQLDEGPCLQQLQTGPVEAEPRPAAAMRAYAEAEGLTLDGRHHQIYLSDPRRVPPERQRVILRQPLTPRRDRVCRPLGRTSHAA